jgi:hypothetical protein
VSLDKLVEHGGLYDDDVLMTVNNELKLNGKAVGNMAVGGGISNRGNDMKKTGPLRFV